MRLHPPVRVYRARPEEHITRPNLCHVNDAVAVIAQQSLDYNDVLVDRRLIFLSADAGSSWKEVARDADVGSYSLFSESGREAIVMPYDSQTFGSDGAQITGPRVRLSWSNGKFDMTRDRTVARFPRELMTFRQGVVGEPFENKPPLNKPITSFWGTIQRLTDGRLMAPAYGCYADDKRSAIDNPLVAMRRMGRFTNDLLVSSDEGRTWSWHCTIATARDIPADCTEGASEVHLFRFGDLWRAVFRVSGIEPLRPVHFCESRDGGRTWTRPAVLWGVGESMDPRGVITEEGVMLLCAGRKAFELYIGDGSGLQLHPLNLIEHHNLYCEAGSAITRTYFGEIAREMARKPGEDERSNTTSHTDVLQTGRNCFLFAYDYAPEGWRVKEQGLVPRPDEIFAIRVEIEG